MAPPVLFELFGIPTPRLPAALTRMATDRARLARTRGLVFWKLLGTGDGRTFDVRDADLRTWGLLTVWEDDVARARYSASSPVAEGWRGLATEAWRAELRPLASRGTWSGRRPFGELEPRPHTGPAVAITRARLHPGRVRTFRRAVPTVSAALREQPGLRLAVGIGEAPVGLQGTFSVWESSRSLTDFAYRGAPHRAVVDATPEEGWYREELFARFALESTRGTIFGANPLPT